MSGHHGRLRLVVAVSQALSLSALAAAMAPLFSGRPAPLGLTVVLIVLSVVLGLVLGLRPRGEVEPATSARRRAALAVALWGAATALLILTGAASQALAVVWGVVGVATALAAMATARLDGEDVARSLVTRSALAAFAAAILGAVLGHGLLPGTAALGVVALLVAAIVHAMARSHYRAVDPDRVGRSASAVVGVIAALAVLLAIGPVHDAVGAALAFAWQGVAYALLVVATGVGYVLYFLILLLRALVHPHPRHASSQPTKLGKTPVRPPSLVHAPPLLEHLGPFLLLLLAAAIAVWLAGRLFRRRPEDEEPPYRDEILDPRSVGRRRHRAAVRRAPAPGLARAYAQALSVLAAAADGRAHPKAADTPAAAQARAAAVLEADGPALALFRRLTAAYAEWHYGNAENRLPDPAERVLRALRDALPPARRGRGTPQP